MIHKKIMMCSKDAVFLPGEVLAADVGAVYDLVRDGLVRLRITVAHGNRAVPRHLPAETPATQQTFNHGLFMFCSRLWHITYKQYALKFHALK